MHHTKDKGDIGSLKLQSDLCNKGFKILFPLTEHLPFDFAAYRDGRFTRIQAKYITPDKNNKIYLSLRTHWNDRNGEHTKYYNDEVDFFGIYCPATDRCYYVPRSFIKNKNGITLAFESKNGQIKGVNLLSELSQFDQLSIGLV